MASRRSVPIVKMVNLGRISYAKASAIQGLLQQQHLKDPEIAHHVLLTLEHDPVYTFGYREKIPEEVRKDLEASGADIVKSDRGGLTTFHGPGQLVAYPVLNLKTFRNMSLRKYVNLLEMSAIHTCRMMGVFAVKGQESVAHTGAWVADKKICAIGVHCKRYVTTHGLALNCNTNLEYFEKIVPCGIPDKGVTSLSAELSKDVSVSHILSRFKSSFESIFICQGEECGLNDTIQSGLLEQLSINR